MAVSPAKRVHQAAVRLNGGRLGRLRRDLARRSLECVGAWLAYRSNEFDLHAPPVPGSPEHEVRLPHVGSRVLPRLREGRAHRYDTRRVGDSQPEPLRAKAARLSELRDGEGLKPWRRDPLAMATTLLST